MIELYTYRTSNGRKVSIMLEELGLPYRVRLVDITKGDQDAASFRALSPNGRIPVIVDPDGPDGGPYTVFESAAILMYLAEKTGRFMPRATADRYEVVQWLMFQVGGVGPMFGQAFHFLHQAPGGTAREALDYGADRYGAEVARLCAVLDARLSRSRFLARDYSIADIAIFPWVALHRWLGIGLDRFANLDRWYREIKDRPAVRRGMDVPARD